MTERVSLDVETDTENIQNTPSANSRTPIKKEYQKQTHLGKRFQFEQAPKFGNQWY